MVVKHRFRLFLFCMGLMAAFMLLAYRLYYLQIENGAKFVGRIPGEKRLRARVPPVRGEILDCNGIVLARNRPTFEVRINLTEVINAKIAELKIKSGGKPVALPKITRTVREGGFEREEKETDIVAIMEEKVFTPLREMKLAKEAYDPEKLRIHFRTFGGTVPWVYRSDLPFEDFSQFAEHNLQIPGVVPEVRPVRQYLYDSLGCHVLGYVRLPDEKLVPKEERAKWDYFVADDYGFTGVEKTLDTLLRGEAGARVWLKDQRGRLVRELKDEYVPPTKGRDVWLTIDARIQIIAERALRDAGLGRSAIVVLDPNNGDVKAMACVPCYNPNKFIPTISVKDFDEYRLNPVEPLRNRAVEPYNPGSTYKIVTAFAGVLEHIQKKYFNCGGSVTYGGTEMDCWIKRQSGGAHGSLDLSDAIMRSCNCYFYQYGNAAGLSQISRAGKMLGVGERTGIELDTERGGILPSKEWMERYAPLENWRSQGHVANTSIGQGKVEATPLQMCSVAATVANGGKSYQPHLVKRISMGPDSAQEIAPILRSDLATEGIAPKDIELIRRGMWKVVNGQGGTGKAAQIPELAGVEVAGKTGTAQFWRKGENGRVIDNHTLFISFAPYDQPKYAICVIVQGGKSGGSCAAPVAKRVLSQSLALDQGFEVAIEPMSEVHGNFTPVEQVVYADDPMAGKFVASVDGDTGTQAGERESRVAPMQSRAVADENMIRQERNARSEPTPQPANRTPNPPERRGILRRLFNNQ